MFLHVYASLYTQGLPHELVERFPEWVFMGTEDKVWSSNTTCVHVLCIAPHCMMLCGHAYRTPSLYTSACDRHLTSTHKRDAMLCL